jgi:hypothetical protein
MPIFIAESSIPGGITTVQQTDIRPGPPQFSSFARAHGMIVAVNADKTVQVQSSGLVTLPVAEWDVATGASGGLTQGHLYYPAIFPALGLTAITPTTPGTWKVPVGVALDATTMLLVLGTIEQVLGNAIYFAQNTGAASPVGTPVFAADTNLKVSPAVNSNIPSATVVGLIAALNDGAPIVQTSSPVTLTPAEWAVVTDTGGLIAGNRYYVSDRAGILTATRPTKPGAIIALVGTAISTTQLLLSTPSVPIPLG